MLPPLHAFTVDLITDPPLDYPIPPGCHGARILVCCAGAPIGIVHPPVRHDHVRQVDLLAEVRVHHTESLARLAVRRALLNDGLPGVVTLHHATRPESSTGSAVCVSVAICTRDRPDDLSNCLASIARLDPPPAEVVVVDNAPATPATARLVSLLYPAFKYVVEPTPGLDHARNRAIAESTGEVIAFTDDDVVVDANWVGALAALFAAEPSLGLVTGLIEPAELETDAQLLFERYGGFGRGCERRWIQARRDEPLPWRAISAGQLSAGANMAFRRSALLDTSGFDPALDVGTPTRGGGDHEVFFRVIRAGWLCAYEPAARVRHRHRRSLPELHRLMFDYGHGTRCFLDAVGHNFPAERRGLRQLRRWWWRHWAWARWAHAMRRPALVPAHLVVPEIQGYLRARGVYKRTRQAMGLKTSDVHTRGCAGVRNQPTNTIKLAIELSEPLRPIEQGRSAANLELALHWHGQWIGEVQVSPLGCAISAKRLADEIVAQCWRTLLRPATADTADALAKFSVTLEQLDRSTPVLRREGTRLTTTIVIATCDRPDALRRCLGSVVPQAHTREAQIVVVNNRPETPSVAEVVAAFPKVELIVEPRPGSSCARNAGISAARGDIIVMIDDDMEATPGWLDELLAPFARADVAIVTGNTLPAQVTTDAERAFELYNGFSRGARPREFNEAWFHRYRRRAVPTWQIGGTGNAAFRASLFHRSGLRGFDERLGAGTPAGVGEDTKLFYEALLAGFTILYTPAAVARHHHRLTMPDLRRQLRAYSRGHVAYQLLIWWQYRDHRALVRLGAELPLAFLRRMWNRCRGRYPYPWWLFVEEISGTLAGPWALWRSARLARRVGPISSDASSSSSRIRDADTDAVPSRRTILTASNRSE